MAEDGRIEAPLKSYVTFTVLFSPSEVFNSPLILGLIELEKINEISVLNKNKNTKNSVKLICIGKVPENDLRIGLKVRISKIEDKYFFMKINHFK